jgi:hypothetical protein
VVDIIGLGPNYRGPVPVSVRRQYVTLPSRLPLEKLNWPDTAHLPWVDAPNDPAPLNPGDRTELVIPVGNSDQAVLVRYEVMDPPGVVVTRFVNEAEIEVDLGEPVPPPEDVVCTISDCDVFIKWINGDEYDQVIITRDGAQIAVLPPPHTAGTSEEYSEPVINAGPGWHTYCVIGVMADGNASKPSCCRIYIPPVLPVKDLKCVLTDDCTVVVSLINGSDYDSKTVLLDGNPIMTVPGPHPAGQPETFEFNIPDDIPPGGHVICVVGEWCGLESEEICCEIEIARPDPVEELSCTQIRGYRVRINFVNGDDYDEKRIYDGAGNVILTIPGPHTEGDTQTHIIKVDKPGDYTFCVAGIWCGLASERKCCDIRVWPEFIRGDSNDDGKVDIVDAIKDLDFLFGGGDPPPCMDASDANDDGEVDITDAIAKLLWLFGGGPPPKPPFPRCFIDPTPYDGLDCQEYTNCPDVDDGT